MSLLQGLVGARINETLENYSRADQMVAAGQAAAAPVVTAANAPEALEYGYDYQFWEKIFAQRQQVVNKIFYMDGVILSEWVARVPGLAVRPESRQMMHLTHQQGQPRRLDGMGGVQVYEPFVKSAHVMSGVGTLRLPPNSEGEWLFSVSSEGDASLGAPVLVTPDVWDRIQRNGSCEGLRINCAARWRPMAMEWSKHFRSTGEIPPGYFVLNNPDMVEVDGDGFDTWVTPFSIMEYASETAELFDYVYCGANTRDSSFRKALSTFFDRYRVAYGGAHSRYLIAGDMVEELWAADYNSPADLLAQDGSARSQLSLLMARVNEHMLGVKVLDELLAKMGSVLSVDDLLRLSAEVGIEARVWQKANSSLAEQCSQFLAAVCEAQKQDALLERLAMEKMEMFGG